MWHMRTLTIPVIVGGLGLIGKGTDRLIEGVPGSPCLKEKKLLTSTAHTLRRALSMYNVYDLCFVLFFFFYKNDQRKMT